MKEKFEYGEKVMVRDHDTEPWLEKCYLMTAPEGKYRYITVSPSFMEGGFPVSGARVYPFIQIRKIQKPEPIEHWVGRLQTQVMSLMDRVGKIEDELRFNERNKPLKNN